MTIFTKNRVINWGIAFLVIVNIGVLGTLGVLFFRRSPGPEPAQRFLQAELQLTETQVQQVEELKRLYQGKMKALDDEVRELKEAIMEEAFLSSPDTEKIDQFAEKIGAKQAELERLRFQHFLALKSLFQPEQTEKFQTLIRDILRPPAGQERPTEQIRPSRSDEPSDRKKPPRPDEPLDWKKPPDQMRPPRPDERPREPRPKG